MAKLKILVVAELDSIGGFISELLGMEGFDVTVVDPFRPIEEIYAELSRQKYDLVLPTNNGFSPKKIPELISEIKKKNRAAKIIVLSGWDTAEFVNDLKEQGIDDFMSMPFDGNDLLRKVKAFQALMGERK